MENKIKDLILANSEELFGLKIDEKLVQFQKTRKDVEGDITLVVFPFVKMLKLSPIVVGEKLGEFLKKHIPTVESFEVVSGFLNLSLTKDYWKDILTNIMQDETFGMAKESSGKTYMVEYSSPNTNKPLHLGHMRNIFLGYSVAEILKANGHEVVKTQIVNDRGIHVCKSMIAWQQYAPKDANGNRETPLTAGVKGDHFVGKYYVEFDKQVTAQGLALATQWKDGNYSDANISEEAKDKLPGMFTALADATDEKSKISLERKIAAYAIPFTDLTEGAKEMLLKWEQREPSVIELWETMNGWVYSGFEETYKRMEVGFDKNYYESDTYLLGKDVVEEGLTKGVFYRKDDGSVWVDLTDEGLDEKLVLRGDGTAVYITQDIGTAIQRYRDYPKLNGIIYTVGNEQDYHFQVLFLILKKLGYEFADNCYHLSYGMVDLPDGKMKSREGRVVDADDLMAEVIQMAKESTQERGYLDSMTEAEKDNLYETIGMGGVKYFILKVDPKKRMTFNPDESIELNGNTGAFIQYAYARIQSLLSKVEFPATSADIKINTDEKELIKILNDYPSIIQEAGKNFSPAVVVNYTYELVKEYNSFYQSNSIMNENDEGLRNARILISKKVGEVIKLSMKLIGAHVPNRM